VQVLLADSADAEDGEPHRDLRQAWCGKILSVPVVSFHLEDCSAGEVVMGETREVLRYDFYAVPCVQEMQLIWLNSGESEPVRYDGFQYMCRTVFLNGRE
jgi:hypothetical protein